ncbi:hypothetical protein GCM10020256_12210 [Streptomyces thermocoprophilus]
MRAGAFDITTKPHRRAPVRLRRLTAPRADPTRTVLGGASPYHPSITGAVTRLSPTTPTPPDRDTLTCAYAPALD